MRGSRSPAALGGLRVLVTRPAGEATSLRALLEDAGASVIEFPTISIADPASWADVDAAIDRLLAGSYDWVLFSSATGADRFVGRLEQTGRPAALAPTRVAAVGPVTRARLESHGVRVDFVPSKFTAQALGREVAGRAARALLPRAADTPDDMPETLRVRGWEIDEIAVYRTVVGGSASSSAPSVRAGKFDVVTFASASSVRGFVDLTGSPASVGVAATGGSDKTVVCIGPVTAQAARELGVRVDATAREHTAAGVVDALIDHLAVSR